MHRLPKLFESGGVLRDLRSLASLHGLRRRVERGGDGLDRRLIEWLSTHAQAEREFQVFHAA
jgi:hypothetical protein